jgi:hypothetical protein
MGGFNPAWFIATAIGVALLAIDILMPKESRKKIGWELLSLSALLLIVGCAGLGLDAYANFWKKVAPPETIASAKVEVPQRLTTKDKKARSPGGHSQVSAGVDWHDKQNWRRFLHTGMTKTEVRRLFGDPEQISVYGDMEFWDYGGHAEIVFADESLYSWTEPQGAYQPKPQ